MSMKPAPASSPGPSLEPEFRGRVYDSIIETIGATPLVRLGRLAEDQGVKAEILAKCEFFNPLGSVKDRIGIAMVEAAERQGRIKAGSTLIEPTSGNTGISLAFVCAAKGYRLILTMPESMSEERRKMLKLLGAEIELTPAELGMRRAIERAEELVEETPGAIMLQQFTNPANPEIHRRTTAEAIWIDTGCAQVLKPRNPDLLIVAVEPEDSPVLSGGMPGPHKIQGMGPGFIPEVLDIEAIDKILKIGSESAFEMARRVARLEGLAVGMSSGAALAAALEVGAREDMAGKVIVTFLPDFADRYLSTALFDGLG